MGALIQSTRRRSWAMVLGAAALPLAVAGAAVVGTPAAPEPAAAQGTTSVAGAGPLAPPETPPAPPAPPAPPDPLTVGYAGPGGYPIGADALLTAYRSAMTGVPEGCHLSVSLLAAIGQAESGPLGGAAPASGAAEDAALATARSLCDLHRDLSRPDDLRAALLARTDSQAFVRLVLILKARYDLVGLGLVGAPGPVLVPLLLEQATALVADPYGPAVVYPSRARNVGAGRLPSSAAGVGAPTGAPDPQTTRHPQGPGLATTTPTTAVTTPAAAAAAEPDSSEPVTPAGQPAADEAASPAAPEPASPSAVTESPDPGEDSGGPEPTAAPSEAGTDVAEPSCAPDAAVATPDAGTASDPPLTDGAEPTDPGAPTADTDPCATEPAPDAGVTAEPEPSVAASAPAPEPARETEPALP